MGHVRDRWMIPGPSGRKVRGPRYGHGKRWQARWIEHGEERSATFTTRDAAEHHLAVQEVGGGGPSRHAMTVSEFAALWEQGQVHYAPSSAHAAHQRLHVMLLPTLGDKYLSEVTRADMQALVGAWAKSHAASTVRQSFSFVNSMFTAAVRDGLLAVSPCVEVNLPRKRAQRVQPLTADQVRQIAENVPDWYRSMVVVAAATGLRSAELRGLTVDRVVGGDVRVDRQMVDVVRGRPVFGPPKSEAGERNVAMGATAAAALQHHLDAYGTGVEGLVWVTRQRGPVNRHRAADIWHGAIDGLGLYPSQRSGFHQLRHYHASLLIAAGFSPKAVAERLGHDDAAETLKTYAHLWPADHDRMTDAIDAAMTGPSWSVSEHSGDLSARSLGP